MSLRVTWIAGKGQALANFLDRFGLEAVGDTSDELSVPLAGAELESGWAVLLTTNDHFSLDDALRKAGADALAIGCELDERAMFSRAGCVENGRRVWTVSHDPDASPDGVATEGELPLEFVTLKGRIERDQTAAADPDVDYLFELPIELARSVTAYRPLESAGIEWSVVQAKQGKRARSAGKGKTLQAAMKAELLPLLTDLGWATSSPTPKLSEQGEIFRIQDGLRQSIWFEYKDNAEVYIEVWFSVVDLSGGAFQYVVLGRVDEPRVWLPWWKRLTWKHLVELTSYSPSKDRVADAIAGAREDIVIADAFLRDGQPHRKIGFSRRLTKQPWPEGAGFGFA